MSDEAGYGLDTQVCDILASDVTNGEVRVNLGELADGQGFQANGAVWGIDGFQSCPNDPDENGCAQALYLVSGNQKRAIATRDNRWTAKAGALKPGDRAIVTNSAARVFVKKASGEVILYTENEKDGNSSQLVNVSGKQGTNIFLCGSTLITQDKDSITLSAGGTTLTVDSSGVTIFGAHFACNTGGGNLGVLGVIAPPPGVCSVIIGPAGIVGVPSSRWTMAP